MTGPFATARRGWRALHACGHEEVSSASLAAFRVLYGLLAFVSATRALGLGWVESFYVQPEVHFTYFGFDFVQVAPPAVMHGVFVAMAALGVLLAVGLFTRAAAVLHLVLFTYVELVDVSTYLNHYYLFSLLGLWLVILPVGRMGSVDAIRAGSSLRVIPRWMLWALRVQVGAVYVHAALAKLSADWLLHGQPLGLWLASRTDFPLVGAYLSEPWVAIGASWAGFLNDLAAPFLLLHRRTRPWMYAVLVFFHVVTSMLFNIGLFPFIMLGAATIFFDPAWPKRLFARLGRHLPRSLSARRAESAKPLGPLGPLAAAALVAFLTFQVLYPLRANLYAGNVLWHEQGMRFSWRVLCRQKAGSVTYRVRWEGRERELRVSPNEYLSRMQESQMSEQPDLILQLAHHIADEHRRQGRRGVEVRVDAWVSLNGRPMARIVDPNIDLTTVEDGFGPAAWILPEPEGPPHPLQPSRLASR